MITVTQFSSVVLKTAKQHLSKMAPRQQPATDASPTAKPEAPTEAPGPKEGPPPAEADGSTEAQASPEEAPAPDDTSDATAAADIAMLVEQMGLNENRAARLVDALSLVGNRLDRVRKVSVVQVEGAPAQATKIGEFAYVVDMLPTVGGRGGQGRDRRGGRGGKQGGRGGKPGGRDGPGGGRGRPGVGGKKPEVEDLSGPFSMDAATADRKEADRSQNKRSGPGGRGGRPGGRGGRPGGGRGGPGGSRN